ncbi:helix-turn-helix transcriptional regulator [Poseidonibacter ostreae]|jgi:AraC-like DNA-binding protein|uniref:Helix-turn-helix domain-containing protein n=1 Tax=Poseidonibacter ostreae TaxID=2654171 RepID=A0A6L4WRF9_9BACT|nr:helix-turn-helix transcriptional regulator [Poseidonibacter ostreae]KAB7884189.1 helix-turn-helix domain-containing protein [Poseidonibacter ostreae]KAB7888095.1 helix-turn-helix domain-containing protein [Poseidonibacter ostreae]KAB7891710.1 helix-turn-helix domain-containing protein [Poseidonibacter ostreae]MAC82541.1 AraC family transcriptional regulator [Arcobacter sp.]|tara:strand:- start:4411 stop:5331 length:921 start_codon:yes stop_codon:yes gene_type:complete
MDSFFFNLTDTKYKTTKLFEKKTEYITRVDISNSIVFFDINLTNNKDMKFPVKNLDRMLVISVIQDGEFSIHDNVKNKDFSSKKDDINIYCSSKQNFILNIKESKESKIFILFIADFFLKRYLSFSKTEPIDFLYEKIQEDISLEQINSQPLDAFSLYIIDKIINSKQYPNMNSIRYEHNIIEFIIHRFTLLDMSDENINEEELQIAKRAKEHLLKNFVQAPTINILAHLCATNESKLKKIFKKVYKMTIYNYIQKLRLEKANLLLKDRVLNIGEIARDVGYKHQGHFSKLFFETYGIYPKDLLKN